MGGALVEQGNLPTWLQVFTEPIPNNARQAALAMKNGWLPKGKAMLMNHVLPGGVLTIASDGKLVLLDFEYASTGMNRGWVNEAVGKISSKNLTIIVVSSQSDSGQMRMQQEEKVEAIVRNQFSEFFGRDQVPQVSRVTPAPDQMFDVMVGMAGGGLLRVDISSSGPIPD